MQITVTLPDVRAPQRASNLLGLAGMIGLVVCIGALAGNWWWSGLTASVAAIALAWVANAHAQAAAAKAAEDDRGAAEDDAGSA